MVVSEVAQDAATPPDKPAYNVVTSGKMATHTLGAPTPLAVLRIRTWLGINQLWLLLEIWGVLCCLGIAPIFILSAEVKGETAGKWQPTANKVALELELIVAYR